MMERGDVEGNNGCSAGEIVLPFKCGFSEGCRLVGG